VKPTAPGAAVEVGVIAAANVSSTPSSHRDPHDAQPDDTPVKRLPVDRRRRNGLPVLRHVMLRIAQIPHAGETALENRQFTYY